MKPVICIEMLFPGETEAYKIEKTAEAGFSCIEFWGWRNKDLQSMKNVCADRKMEAANFSAQRTGDLIDEQSHGVVLEDYRDALKAAELLGTGTLMALTNELGEMGRVVNRLDELHAGKKRESVIACLRSMLRITPEHMNLVIAPLNTVKDHAGYYLSSMEDAVSIIKEIDDSRIKILCDLYHQGMTGEDLEDDVSRYLPYIGYFHIADIPERDEPRADSQRWLRLLRQIQAAGYEGFVGFEYSPKGDSAESLRQIAELWGNI